MYENVFNEKISFVCFSENAFVLSVRCATKVAAEKPKKRVSTNTLSNTKTMMKKAIYFITALLLIGLSAVDTEVNAQPNPQEDEYESWRGSELICQKSGWDTCEF